MTFLSPVTHMGTRMETRISVLSKALHAAHQVTWCCIRNPVHE
jgi:hypothetical protein